MQLLNKLTDSIAQQNFKMPLLVKISVIFQVCRQEQLSKYKEMKQQYRTVCFRGTELIGKYKKQSVIKSNSAAHSTTVTKPAQSPVPVINKRQPQHSSRQLTPCPQSSSALPTTWPALSPAPMNKRPPKQYYRQLTPHATCPSESSADTNFPSKRSHYRALQPLPPSRLHLLLHPAR